MTSLYSHDIYSHDILYSLESEANLDLMQLTAVLCVLCPVCSLIVVFAGLCIFVLFVFVLLFMTIFYFYIVWKSLECHLSFCSWGLNLSNKNNETPLFIIFCFLTYETESINGLNKYETGLFWIPNESRYSEDRETNRSNDHPCNA